MDLVLKVIEDATDTNMLNHTKAFTASGGSFGRSDTNDWVLPDHERIISSLHARIQFDGNQFLLYDESTNGTFHNESESPIGAGNSIILNNGDKLKVGDYLLSVSLKEKKSPVNLPDGLEHVDFLDNSDKTTFSTTTSKPDENRDFDKWLEPVAIASASSQSPPWGSIPSSQKPQGIVALNAAETDPLKALDRASPAKTLNNEQAWADDHDWWKEGSQRDNAPVINHAMPNSHQPNNLQSRNQPIPESQGQQEGPCHIHLQPQSNSQIDEYFSQSADSQQQLSNSVDCHRPRMQQPAQADFNHGNISASSNLIQELGNELGLGKLDSAQRKGLIPEAANIITETVNRLVDLLRARTSIKNELRVQRTMIQSIDNNPLKFSVSAEDALKVMLNGDNSAFLTPTEAIKDSFDDLSDHQVAVLAGMRAAYESMLLQFSPTHLERCFNHDMNGGILSNKKARRWEAYENHFNSLREDSENTYQLLFGEHFANAYETQLSELKSVRALTEKH